MADFPNPHLIHFPTLGEPSVGYISVAAQSQLMPFAVQRIFWTYHTPEAILRGRHAHHVTELVLIAIAGRIIVTTELANGSTELFRLEDPNVGLYIPPHAWHTMQYSHKTVQLAFASTVYNEADYIRNYDDFLQMWGRAKG